MLAAKRLALIVVLMLVLHSGCGQVIRSDADLFHEWLSEQLVAVESIDFPLSSHAQEFFRTAMGSARVVGIGESRHDTREQLRLKGLLIRHLVEDLGFRALIIEESCPHAEAIDRYVTSGEGDLHLVMEGLAGWYLWDTEEMGEFIEWIRQFNDDREAAQQVRIFGMDITAPALGVEAVLRDLHAAGIGEHLNAADLGLELQTGDDWPTTWERYRALSGERKEELAGFYRQLADLLKEQRLRLVTQSSEKQYQRLLLFAEIGGMGNALFSAKTREQGGAIREHGMAQVTLRVLDRELPGEKAVIWAHNLHVAKSSFRMPSLAEGRLDPMGVYLSEALGDAYLAIGGAFGKGTFPADHPPGKRSFDVLTEDVMDGALARADVSTFLLDLRDTEAASGAARWLQQEREWNVQDSRAILVPSAAYDLVYFVAQISRSHLTARAMERFQTLGVQN